MALKSITLYGLDFSGGSFVVEASTAGLQPGEWPAQLVVNGRLFELQARDFVDGDLVGARYRVADPTAIAVLRILND